MRYPPISSKAIAVKAREILQLLFRITLLNLLSNYSIHLFLPATNHLDSFFFLPAFVRSPAAFICSSAIVAGIIPFVFTGTPLYQSATFWCGRRFAAKLYHRYYSGCRRVYLVKHFRWFLPLRWPGFPNISLLT